jgi:hypothetical protein
MTKLNRGKLPVGESGYHPGLRKSHSFKQEGLSLSEAFKRGRGTTDKNSYHQDILYQAMSRETEIKQG